MRVALNVEQLLYSPPGGVGRYTTELARRLTLPGPGDGERTEVVPFVARHRRADVAAALARFDLDGLEPVPLWLPRPLLYDAWDLLEKPPSLRWRRRALHDLDVIHAPSVAVPPRSGAAGLVVTVHDAAVLLFPDTYPWRGRWVHRRGLATTARRADLVIAPTQAAADEVVAATAIHAERIRVVPHGVELELADDYAAVQAARTAFGLEDLPYVLWVGTLEPRKNLPVLLDAFAAVARAGLPHRLVVVGPPGWREGARATEASALGERLVVTGAVRGRQLTALYRGATLFAYPSRHEGFGMPLLEALAQATPALCSDLPVMHEVAADAARFVPASDVAVWGDALVSLLRDEPALAALGAAGRHRAEGFTWGRCLERTRAVYREAQAAASG